MCDTDNLYYMVLVRKNNEIMKVLINFVNLSGVVLSCHQYDPASSNQWIIHGVNLIRETFIDCNVSWLLGFSKKVKENVKKPKDEVTNEYLEKKYTNFKYTITQSFH